MQFKRSLGAERILARMSRGLLQADDDLVRHVRIHEALETAKALLDVRTQLV